MKDRVAVAHEMIVTANDLAEWLAPEISELGDDRGINSDH